MSDGPMDLHIDQPHSARMYDYFLGGKDHYEADRIAAGKVVEVFPSARLTARTNRDFMHRATRFHAEQGIRQFLDIGTGIPTEPNLHQVAQKIAPEARVVYADNDPVVLAHVRALIVGTPEGRTAYIQADVSDPESILDAPQLSDTLDLTQPVALSLIAVAHFLPDDAHRIVAVLLNALAPGSYLAMTHATADFDPVAHEVMQAYGGKSRLRSREEFTQFFTGLELVDPGITTAHRWHCGIEPPKGMDAQVPLYAAVGRKPVS